MFSRVDGAFMRDAPRAPAWRRPAPMSSEQVQKADRRASGGDGPTDAARLTWPSTAAESPVQGSAEGAPPLPAPWPMFPNGHSVREPMQRSSDAAAPSAEGSTAPRPNRTTKHQDVPDGSGDPTQREFAALHDRQPRCRRVLSSDGSVGSFMRAEAAASAATRLTSPPRAGHVDGLTLALPERVQTEHDGGVKARGATSVQEDTSDPRMADMRREACIEAELLEAAAAGTHLAVAGQCQEQTAPQARTEEGTEEEHPSAHKAAPHSGETDHRATAQTGPADADAAAELHDGPLDGSHATVGPSTAVQEVETPSARHRTHPTSTAPTATGEGEVSTRSDDLNAHCFFESSQADVHLQYRPSRHTR